MTLSLKPLFWIAGIAAGFSASAQTDTLFTVAGDPVSTEEFSYVFNKNRDIGKDIDPKTPREYLDLYIHFKLKVHEAESLGMDTASTFKREFGQYRAQLARPYLTDKAADEAVLEQAYERMLMDVHAAHIMIDLPANALPEDTARVYNQLMNYRKEILNGQNFDKMARSVSTDTYSAQQGGDLGWFTVFNMVYPFENAAYSLPPGEISKPIRTQYGYHLVKVIERRPARYKVDAAHILALVKNAGDQEEVQKAYQRMEEIYSKLEAGEDFATLAQQYSDDKTSASKGGDLPTFGMRDMLPEFEETVYSLKDGEYSKVFRTKIGWHIVKLKRKYPVPSFDQVRAELEDKIRRDSRSNVSHDVFVQRLKRDYNLKINSKNLTSAIKSVNENFLSNNWKYEGGKKYNKVVASFANVEITQDDFLKYLMEVQPRVKSEGDVNTTVFGIWNEYINRRVLNYEDSHLADKYPAFRYLVREYREGILLFDLTKDKVWDKAVRDTTGLEAYHKAHADKYQWQERRKFVRFKVTDEKIAKKVAKDAKKGKSAAEIVAKYNKESQLVVLVDSATAELGSEEAIFALPAESGVYGPTANGNGFNVVKIEQILPAGPKTLTEARGMVISDYQKKLEEDWIAELKGKFEVKINEKTFDALLPKLQ